MPRARACYSPTNQMTAFVAVLTMDANRQRAGRIDCCCCFTSEKYLAGRVRFVLFPLEFFCAWNAPEWSTVEVTCCSGCCLLIASMLGVVALLFRVALANKRWLAFVTAPPPPFSFNSV